ncbi:DinB family protein [Alteribacter natronophilus]|uniref:DinB family protein n=1 Tax=Alteribacter natronophilus TaxID=2583810 RepID=UPI00110F58DD|nr:DinB family protein [Alteribacter natronophilus]TMW71407.1 DinB family protein [Alteribacter natronophilus]
MKSTFDQFEQAAEPIESLMAEGSHDGLYEPIAEGKWSIREIVGHMYMWDRFLLENMVPHMEDGGVLPAFPDHDRFNREAINGLEGVSVEEIVSMFVKTREKLVQELKGMDPAIRFTIGKGKRRFSPESFVKMFIKHDRHHIMQIEKKLEDDRNSRTSV